MQLELRSQSAFRRNPAGGFVAGENWIYFCFDASLFGYAIWGGPSPADIRKLVRLLELELDRRTHAALVDLEHVELVHAEAFEALVSYTRTHEQALARAVTHTAIVRPPGVNGAIVSGFFEMAGKPFPFSFWPSQESALAHLGRSDARACSLALADARQRNSSTPAFLQALRAHLGNAKTSTAPSLDAFARDLALSPRTLQRRLAEQKTSFAAEVQLARIEAAGRLLLHSNLTVIEIALELGFRSPQHFATLFRKHKGVTPTAFRSVSAKK